MFELGKGVLEDTLREGEREYGIRVEDALPGIYSVLEIKNGSITTIECGGVEDTVRLLLEINQRHALGEVTGRWRRARIADVLHYFDRRMAFTGARVRLPNSRFMLYSDVEDFLAMQITELMHTSSNEDFQSTAARFRGRNRYAKDHALYMFHGAVYDENGKWIGYVGDDSSMLDGFTLFTVRADNIRIARLNPIKKPHYLSTVGLPYEPGRRDG